MNIDFTKIDYNGIKSQLQQKLAADGVLTDFDIISSNTDLYLSTLSMITTMINQNINYVSNEAFIDTAVNRKNILKHANALGYKVERKVSAKIVATCTFTLLNNRVLTIPKWTKFLTKDGTTFLTQSDLIYTNISGASKTYIENIELIEGTIVDSSIDSSLNFLYNQNTVNFNINYKNIETNGITIIANKGKYNETTYTESRNLLNDIISKNNVFNARTDPDTGYVRISFLPKYGIAPNTNDDISISVLLSNGINGNNYTKLKNTVIKDRSVNVSDISMNDVFINVNIDIKNKSFGGANEESNTDIKMYAPVYKNTQGRIVTNLDWEAFLANEPQITSPKVFGGDEIGMNLSLTGFSDAKRNALKKPGYVFISGMPASINTSGDKYFSINDIENIKTIMRENSIIALRRVFVQPYYMEMNIVANIHISPTSTKRISDIARLVSNVIRNYVKRSFNFNFKKSKLINLIFELQDIDDVNIDGTYISNSITKQMFYNTDENNVTINLPVRSNSMEVNIPMIESTEPNIYTMSLVDIPDGINISNAYDYNMNSDTFLDYIGIRLMNYELWNAGATYSINYVIKYNGFIYKSLTSNNIGNTPPGTATSNAIWQYYPKTSNYMDNEMLPVDFTGYKRISLKYNEYAEWSATHDGYPLDTNSTGYKKGDVVSNIANGVITMYISLKDFNSDVVNNMASWQVLNVTAEEAASFEHLIGVYLVKENMFIFNSAIPYKKILVTIPDYLSTTAYVKGDIIQYPAASGTYYIARKASTGITPGTNLVYWATYVNEDKFNINIMNIPKNFRYTTSTGLTGFPLDNLIFNKETVVELQSQSVINF